MAMLYDPSSGVPMPLRSLSVSALVIDGHARVKLTHTFVNNLEQDARVEALFKMPMDEQAAVCGFRATIGGRVIVGRVDEKGRAAVTYDTAVREGKVACLCEEERADVFLIAVGNVAHGEVAVVETTLLTRLAAEGSDLRFTVPATIGERYHGTRHRGGDTSDAAVTAPPRLPAGQRAATFDVDISLELSAPLRCVTSPTHPIAVEIEHGPRGGARVSLAKSEFLDRDLVVVFSTLDPHRSTACCELDPANRQVTAMLSFSPDLGMEKRINIGNENDNGNDSDENDDDTAPVIPDRTWMERLICGARDSAVPPAIRIVFLVDRSGSMSGSKMEQCRNALQLFLRSLPAGAEFNLVSFGSHFESLFGDGCRPLTESNLDTATAYVSKMQADMGGTNILDPIEKITGVSRYSAGGKIQTQVILLTDGQVSNTQSVLGAVSHAAGERGTHRFFTLGVGDGCSRELVAGIARVGGGCVEFVAPGEPLSAKVMRQLRRASAAPAARVLVEWIGSNGETIETTGDDDDDEGDEGDEGEEKAGDSSKRKTLRVFPGSGDRVTVLAGFRAGVRPCKARLTLTGMSRDTGEVLEPVVIDVPPAREGSFLATLRARERVRTLQEQRGDKAKDRIVEIATASGIASRFTSFVAVDATKRKKAKSALPLTVIVPQGGRALSNDQSLDSIMRNIQEIKAMQNMCLDTVLDRCDSIDRLEVQSARLELESAHFYSKSSRFRNPFSSLARAVGSIAKSVMGTFSSKNSASMPSTSATASPSSGSSSSSSSSSSSMTTTTTSLSHGSSDLVTLESIVILQRAGGFWERTAALEPFCAALVASYSSATTLPDDCIATLVAIALLRQRHASQRESWALIESKAIAWLMAQGLADVDARIAEAEAIVAAK